MGVDYCAVLYIGKEFDEDCDAEYFVRKHFTLTSEDEEFIEEENLNEWLYNQEDFDSEILNYYARNTPIVIGYDLGHPKPETFQQKVKEAVEKWEAKFPNEKWEIIHTVKVY